ncbi:uncharacterized protein N7498_006714 [Penicillium cinerascens]|uniref:Uncharacterized protein n=1 Tax=Penicillium cinerascens TaxID=70096 RepID=A0A9W9MIM8_9EURO|nr:uncharacterized protein N7498_006714 [Penicillium cinerascens]KAJ5202051.1 hypothetical protein N7498_006714 [Penicillium cinerascens]
MMNPSLKFLIQLCHGHEPLMQPEGLENGDLNDGLSDPPTLFSAERIKLHDVIEISDVEQARQFICMFNLSRLDKKNLKCWKKTRHTLTWSDSKPGGNLPPNPDMLLLASVHHDTLIRLVFPLCSMMTDRSDPSRPLTGDNIWRHFNWKLSNRTLPLGPIQWTEDSDGRKMALAVGGEAGFRRTEIIVILDPVNKQCSKSICAGTCTELLLRLIGRMVKCGNPKGFVSKIPEEYRSLYW